jgi:hypothetical protein
MPGRFAAGEQVQIADREVALFENLHERFADSTGGADHGNIKGLAHGSTSGETGGAALYRVVGMQAISAGICSVCAGLITSKLGSYRFAYTLVGAELARDGCLTDAQ